MLFSPRDNRDTDKADGADGRYRGFVKLSGKTAIVTGASRGIGRCLALALAKEGCPLLLTALEADELAAVVADIEARSDIGVASHVADLTDPAGRLALVEWIRQRDEIPDILINNAGAGWFGAFGDSSWDSLERTLLLDVHVPTFLMHAVLPILKGRPEAMIVNISSAVGSLPYPGLAAYGATKGYLSSLSASLQCELSSGHVHVLCFHPGFTATSFIASAGMDLSKVPRFMVARPESVADNIVRAMKRNAYWVYGDAVSRFGVALAGVLPHRLRIRLFRNFYWESPQS